MFNAFSQTSLYNPVTTGYGFGYSQQKQEIIKVNGREGANAYQMPPNSSVLLLDVNQPVVYLKQTDGGGYANITAYRIEPLQETSQTKTNELEMRIKRLEEIINESNTFSLKSADAKSTDTD